MDVHSGKVDNSVGQTNSMLRGKCNDDRSVGCSYGFHAGTLSYASGWGSKVMLVKIHPKDVVSVPKDCECQKMRCCEYSVISEYTKEGPLGSVYTDDEDPDEDWYECPDCGWSDCDGDCEDW